MPMDSSFREAIRHPLAWQAWASTAFPFTGGKAKDARIGKSALDPRMKLELPGKPRFMQRKEGGEEFA